MIPKKNDTVIIKLSTKETMEIGVLSWGESRFGQYWVDCFDVKGVSNVKISINISNIVCYEVKESLASNNFLIVKKDSEGNVKSIKKANTNNGLTKLRIKKSNIDVDKSKTFRSKDNLTTESLNIDGMSLDQLINERVRLVKEEKSKIRDHLKSSEIKETKQDLYAFPSFKKHSRE